MADRDKIPSGLPSQYKGLCKQVCEQQDPVAIAESALRPLKESVKALGDAPTGLISKIVNRIKPMLEAPFNQILS